MPMAPKWISDLTLTLNLSNRYEQRIIASGAPNNQAIPAVIVTGFLGSGKTTLVRHILRSRSNLRVAVLVNEAGAIDVDGQLVDVKQSNASMGLPGTDLSGGCVCCSDSRHELKAALERIRSGLSQIDYLVVETSGVGEAEPLAEALSSAGFRLESVVTVVDAEAGTAAVESQEVARQQIRAADVVVINKCDLMAGVPMLGAVCDLEDAIRKLVPGARTIRARYGQVPLQAILDVEMEDEDGVAATASARQGVKGNVGFLSHEPTVDLMPKFKVATAREAAAAAGRLRHSEKSHTAQLMRGLLDPCPARIMEASVGTATSKEEQDSATIQEEPKQQQQEQHHHHHYHQGGGDGMGASGGGDGCGSEVHHHHHHHHHHHRAFHTVSLNLDQLPAPLASIQHFLLHHLVTCPGLYRAKGLVWMEERRQARYVLHFSGRKRMECCQDGVWESAPRTQLVFIGTDHDALLLLHDQLLALVAIPPCTFASNDLHKVALAVANQQRLKLISPVLREAAAVGSIELSSEGEQPIADPLVGVACTTRVIEFSAITSTLHGVDGGEVNASMMRVVNAAACGVFLFGIRKPGLLGAVSSVQRADSIDVLQFTAPHAQPPTHTPLDPEDPQAGQPQPALGLSPLEAWSRITSLTDPVLRKAFQHVHEGCRCDVVKIQ